MDNNLAAKAAAHNGTFVVKPASKGPIEPANNSMGFLVEKLGIISTISSSARNSISEKFIYEKERGKSQFLLCTYFYDDKRHVPQEFLTIVNIEEYLS
uniref:LAGLIDADG homing endonuclease n=1 Tax=Romanomermis culicivorax TaxID=13658 RepID=A0A915IDF9_ROMCU